MLHVEQRYCRGTFILRLTSAAEDNGIVGKAEAAIAGLTVELRAAEKFGSFSTVSGSGAGSSNLVTGGGSGGGGGGECSVFCLIFWK